MKVRTKRQICLWIGTAALVLAFLIVGGLEREALALHTGTRLVAACILVGFGALYKGGAFR